APDRRAPAWLIRRSGRPPGPRPSPLPVLAAPAAPPRPPAWPSKRSARRAIRPPTTNASSARAATPRLRSARTSFAPRPEAALLNRGKDEGELDRRRLGG